MKTITEEQLDGLIKSAVNSSGPLPPDEKFMQIISALRELQEYRNARIVPDEIDVNDPALDTHRKWMAEGWNRCRAAMQSGAVKDGWVACSERMPERDYVLAADFSGKQYPANLPNIQIGIYADWFGDGSPCWDDGDGNDLHLKQVTHWAQIPAAPQQEAVSSALEHGMYRYSGAMQKLADGGD